MRKLPILLFIACALYGCGPDLGVIQTKIGYCDVTYEGLSITIENSGDEQASPSKTSVEFGSTSPIIVDTPAVPANSFIVLQPIQIPSPCFNPDCSFSITVDLNGDIKETDETNNTVTGICIG